VDIGQAYSYIYSSPVSLKCYRFRLTTKLLGRSRLRLCPLLFPRQGLDGIADDLGFGRVSDYRLAVLEDDLVLAQITKSILPFLGRKDSLSVLALDQLSLILGAHLIQQYGVHQKAGRQLRGGLAPWQKRRASEILHENMHGCVRLSDVARECGLSASHFARSFKTSLVSPRING
jgi:AraC family transcriptional regulator